MRKTALFTLLSLVAAEAALAGALAIGNVRFRTITRKSVAIQLDLSWQCGWKDEVNHDAVWLFAKYSLDDGETWRHATLRGSGVNPPDYTAGSDDGLDILVTEDHKGAFVRNTAEGIRSPATTGLRLVWDLAADGVSSSENARLRVFGLEMVYVPEGPFTVGEESAKRDYAGWAPTRIESPDATNRYGIAAIGLAGTGTNEDPYRGLHAGLGRPYAITTAALTNDYPNGYRAFYQMKHKLTRQSYLDFLNTLTETQRLTLLGYHLRNGNNVFYGDSAAAIVSETLPNGRTFLSNAQPWRALVFFGGVAAGYGGDVEMLAYLDWAALRPMTDLEYEKSCRGPNAPVKMEFPWGLATYGLPGGVVGANTAGEHFGNPYAPANIGGMYGVRVLTYPQPNWSASTNDADAVEAGASYYGALELAANGRERCVFTASSSPTAGTAFSAARYSGLHGDGELTAEGFSNVTDWPYPQQNYYANGPYVSRGGFKNLDLGSSTISGGDTHMGNNYYDDVVHGIRGVRTAPAQ